MFTAHAYTLHNRFPTRRSFPTPPVLSVSGPELQLVRGSDRERIQDGYRYQVEVRTSRWTCCLMDDGMRVIRNFHTRERANTGEHDETRARLYRLPT